MAYLPKGITWELVDLAYLEALVEAVEVLENDATSYSFAEFVKEGLSFSEYIAALEEAVEVLENDASTLKPGMLYPSYSFSEYITALEDAVEVLENRQAPDSYREAQVALDEAGVSEYDLVDGGYRKLSVAGRIRQLAARAARRPPPMSYAINPSRLMAEAERMRKLAQDAARSRLVAENLVESLKAALTIANRERTELEEALELAARHALGNLRAASDHESTLYIPPLGGAEGYRELFRK